MANGHREAPLGRVAIAGAGPAGVAAAHRLREVASERVGVTLVERSGESEYLPGALPVSLGEAAPESFRQPVEIPGVEVIAGEASQITGSGGGCGRTLRGSRLRDRSPRTGDRGALRASRGPCFLVTFWRRSRRRGGAARRGHDSHRNLLATVPLSSGTVQPRDAARLDPARVGRPG
jgi:hypothetical protein